MSKSFNRDYEDGLLLIDSASVRKQAEEALGGYVGDLSPVRASIDIACRLVDSAHPPRKR